MAKTNDPEKPTPPPVRDRQKTLMTALSIAIPILRQVAQVAIAVMTPEPRTCPRCSYRMVDEVASHRTSEKRTGKKSTVAYWRCSACAARYKTVGDDGPFRPAPADEWAARVHVRFPR